jgi:hypothetical protein
MIYVIWNKSTIKCLSSVFILLFASALLLSGACSPPATPSAPLPPPNQPPIINSLTSENETLVLSESQIVCAASDPDSDNLTYQWSADGGTIRGEGSSIAWTAPGTAGNYTIKAMVTDGKGGTASESTTIAVIDKPNQPPIITGITKDGSPLDEENRIREWRTVTIQCNAEDPDSDNLTYLWRATGGKINGEGNAVGWTSPGVPGDCTVTVVVTDGRGDKAEASIVFTVACCGGGF